MDHLTTDEDFAGVGWSGHKIDSRRFMCCSVKGADLSELIRCAFGLGVEQAVALALSRGARVEPDEA